MTDVVSQAKKELENCKITAEVRKLSAKLYREIDDKSRENIFAICEKLLEERDWAMGVIAYDFAYRIRAKYDDSTFELFETWLYKYISDWGDCDDFCTHAFGELIKNRPHLFSRIKEWTKSEKFWVRRASAIVFIPVISKGEYKNFELLEISDLLMSDEHYLVCKGYGWMLKVLSLEEHDLVFNYLIKNHKTMPRVSYRYAMGKMSKEDKAYLMKL